MRLITNPGTNLPAAAIAQYEIELLPQQIVVDEIHHDTRSGMSLEMVDTWARGAKEHPYVLGTSAAEFAGHLTRLGTYDPELLVIMTSRKLIPSYDACKAACRTLEKHPKWGHLRVRVVDSGMTDIATGMLTTYAAQAKAAGFSLDEVARLAEEFAAATSVAFAVQELDSIVKGGRASFLKAWAARFFGVRPILALVEGQIESAGTFKAKADPTEVLCDWALVNRAEGAGRRVWVGVSHGQDPTQADALADRIESELEVQHRVVLPLTPSIYLHLGRGCITIALTDLDALSWAPGAASHRL